MSEPTPVAGSIPEYIGDVLAGVWPGATRLESNRRNYVKLFEEADADIETTTFLVMFVGFVQKEVRFTDSGQRLQRPPSDPPDQQMFVIAVRFPPIDDAADLRADGYTRTRDAVEALRARCRFIVDGVLYDLDVMGGQAVDPPSDEITSDVFEITLTAE